MPRRRWPASTPVEHRDGYRIEPTEIEPGVVFAKDDFTIEAFSVPHGAVAPAFGFRVTADDKTVVISGDTAYGETLLEMALRSHLPGMRPTSGSAWL